MQAKDVMTRDPKTCRPENTLAAAAKIMWDHDCGCVPVVDDEGRLVGMLTDRDICMAALINGRAIHEVLVSQAMSRNVVRCTPDDAVDTIMAAMARAHVRRVPIVDRNGHVAGIVSLHDVACAVESGGGGWFTGVKHRDVGRTFAEISRKRDQPPNGMKIEKPPVTRTSLTR